MIFQGIVDFLCAQFIPLVECIPDVAIDVEAIYNSSFSDWIRLAGYMFPFDTLSNIFTIVMSIVLARFIIAVIFAIKRALPFI